MGKKYTAADFANAQFAEHPDGRTARRIEAERGTVFAWSMEHKDGEEDYCADEHLAAHGWVPVPTKPTITESEYRLALDEDRDPQYVYGFTAAMHLFGGEVIPDPEPTDEELLAGIIRNIDDWQSITSPELLAKYLNTAGVTVNKENN